MCIRDSMRSLLIRDTTREEREEIVRRALSACGGSCDGCNGCGNSGGGRIEAIYQPYRRRKGACSDQ